MFVWCLCLAPSTLSTNHVKSGRLPKTPNVWTAIISYTLRKEVFVQNPDGIIHKNDGCRKVGFCAWGFCTSQLLFKSPESGRKLEWWSCMIRLGLRFWSHWAKTWRRSMRIVGRWIGDLPWRNFWRLESLLRAVLRGGRRAFTLSLCMDGMDPGMGNMQDKLGDYLWQMCFLAHGSAAFWTGRKCLGKSELAGRLIGLLTRLLELVSLLHAYHARCARSLFGLPSPALLTMDFQDIDWCFIAEDMVDETVFRRPLRGQDT